MWPFDAPYSISYRRSIVTDSLSSAVFEILGPKHIGVTILTFQGHVTSLVMWKFDAPYSISYRCSIVTDSLSPAAFEILGPKHIGVTTSTFQGHVTSQITWRFDSPYRVSWALTLNGPSVSKAIGKKSIYLFILYFASSVWPHCSRCSYTWRILWRHRQAVTERSGVTACKW